MLPSLAYAVVRDGVVEPGGFGGADPQAISGSGSVTKVFSAPLEAPSRSRKADETRANGAVRKCDCTCCNYK